MSDAGDSHIQAFTRTQISTMLVLGVISGVVTALQPLLLGHLAAEGRITLPQIGRTAMAEALGTAIAASLTGTFLKQRLLKPIAFAATACALIANLATMRISGDMILLARLGSGLACGVLLALWVGMLIRVAVPARLIAIYVSLQGGSVLVLSSIVSAAIATTGHAGTGYLCLVGTNILIGILVLFIPRQFIAVGGANHSSIPGGRGMFGLLAVVLHLAGIIGFWVYVLPLGKEAGLSDSFVGLTVSVALGSQIVAGFCAAIIAARANVMLALTGSAAASIAGLVLLAMTPPASLFLFAVCLIAFFWMFAPPFQMPYLIDVDPTRAAATHILTAQLIGVSAGPALASLAVREGHVGGALVVSGTLYLLAGILVVVTLVGRWRRVAAGGTAAAS